MSDQQPPRRVVLALDSAAGRQTLQMALNLAMLIRARIEGLFVEDTDLLRLAALPFAREIVTLNAQLRPIVTSALEQELKSRALHLQRQLAHEAEARQLEWGFSVVRDRLLQAVRSAAGNADLFIFQSPYWRQRTLTMATIGVVYDGSMAPIDIAAQLAQGSTVRILLRTQFSSRRNEITQRMIQLGAHPVFIILHDDSAATIAEVARHQQLSLLFLPDKLTLDDATFLPLLESTPCTVVVREHSNTE